MQKLYKAIFLDRICYFRADSPEAASKFARDNKWELAQDVTEATESEGTVKCMFYKTPHGFYIGEGSVDVDKVLRESSFDYPLTVYTANKPYHLGAYDFYHGDIATCYYAEDIE